MHPPELRARAMHLFQQGQYEGAIACFSSLAEESSTRSEALAYLGQALLALGRSEEAEEPLLIAYRLKGDPDLVIQLGNAQIAQGKWEAARATFEGAIARQPQRLELHLMLGHVLASLGLAAEAVRSYEKAIHCDAANPAPRYYLAEHLVRQRDYIRAIGQLRYLLQREPRYVPAILLMGDISFHGRDFRQAAVEYCRALTIEPPEISGYLRLGDAFAGFGDDTQAAKAYSVALRQDPTSSAAHMALGKLRERQGFALRARAHYHAAAYDTERHAEAQEALARVPLTEGEDEPEDAFDLDAPFLPPQTLTVGTDPLAPLPPSAFPTSRAAKTQPLSLPERAPSVPLPEPRLSDLLPKGLDSLKRLWPGGQTPDR